MIIDTGLDRQRIYVLKLSRCAQGSYTITNEIKLASIGAWIWRSGSVATDTIRGGNFQVSRGVTVYRRFDFRPFGTVELEKPFTVKAEMCHWNFIRYIGIGIPLEYPGTGTVPYRTVFEYFRGSGISWAAGGTRT